MRSIRLACTVGALLVGCGGTGSSPRDPDGMEPPRMGTPSKPGGMDTSMEMEGEAAEPEEETKEPSISPKEPEAASAPESPPEAAPHESSGMRPSHAPSQVLTGPKISFMINYPASAPKHAAEEKCSKDAGEDLAARAKCVSDARKNFIADVMLFKKNAQCRVEWIIYRRDRGTLFEVSTSQVELVNETENAVTLRLLGKGSGARPVFVRATEVVVSVPTDSSIELADPVLGNLVYEAKIGLVGN
jgi:hypothetical protein